MKLVKNALTVVSLIALAFTGSCSHPTALQSITVDPSTVTFNAASPADFTLITEKFTAFGHFIHPTNTVDISNKVTWKVNPASFATVDAIGNVTPTGAGCGAILITATANRDTIQSGPVDQVIVGEATMNLVIPGSQTCGGGTQTLLVSVTDTGGTVSGAISGSATSISGCSNTGGLQCVATVATNSAVTLTASAPATFSANCTAISATQCTIQMPTDQNVTVTF